MIYLFQLDDKIYLSNKDPESDEDLTSILLESVEVQMSMMRKKIPNDIQINVIRNVLSNGGVECKI
jgi:uncharacterized protein YsxB (DUF464 family)